MQELEEAGSATDAAMTTEARGRIQPPTNPAKGSADTVVRNMQEEEETGSATDATTTDDDYILNALIQGALAEHEVQEQLLKEMDAERRREAVPRLHELQDADRLRYDADVLLGELREEIRKLQGLLHLEQSARQALEQRQSTVEADLGRCRKELEDRRVELQARQEAELRGIYEATLVRHEDRAWGLAMAVPKNRGGGGDESRFPAIHLVRPGPAHDFNLQSKKYKIEPNDLLLAINGEVINVVNYKEKLQEASEVKLLFHKP